MPFCNTEGKVDIRSVKKTEMLRHVSSKLTLVTLLCVVNILLVVRLRSGCVMQTSENGLCIFSSWRLWYVIIVSERLTWTIDKPFKASMRTAMIDYSH